MIGVCEFENTVPFCSRKLSRCGICSRSDGTFGLSRKKCTLSNTMLTTCWTPLPRGHDEDIGPFVAFFPWLAPATWTATSAASEAATRTATSVSFFIQLPPLVAICTGAAVGGVEPRGHVQ